MIHNPNLVTKAPLRDHVPREPRRLDDVGRGATRHFVCSPSGSCWTIPNAWPRGITVALWTGSAPGVCNATRAWPPSWNAVILIVSSDKTADFLSAPMRILSLA